MHLRVCAALARTNESARTDVFLRQHPPSLKPDMMNPRLQLFRRAFVPVALATSSTAVYLSLRPVLHADAPSSSTTPSSIPGIPFEPRDHPRKSTKGEFLDENGKPCKVRSVLGGGREGLGSLWTERGADQDLHLSLSPTGLHVLQQLDEDRTSSRTLRRRQQLIKSQARTDQGWRYCSGCCCSGEPGGFVWWRAQ